jgi:hypothetical protein
MHEKHAVTTWNLGTITAVYKYLKIKFLLHRKHTVFITKAIRFLLLRKIFALILIMI